jgi:hypothetical protein
MKSLILIMSAVFIVTGCSSTINKSQNSSSIDIITKSKLNADIDVDIKKILKGSARQVTILGVFDIEKSTSFADGVTYNGGENGFSLFSGGIVESTKAAAAFNAVQKSNADVIVAPKYIIKVESKLFGAYKKVTATVSGYHGTIRSIRSSNK